MLYATIPQKNAEELRTFLLNSGLLQQGYQVIKPDGRVGFPVTKRFRIPSRFKGLEFISKPTQEKPKKTLGDLLRPILSPAELNLLPSGYDCVGSIAIIEVPEQLKPKEREIARALLELHPSIKTVVAKASSHSGEFRLQKYRHLAGRRTLETIHTENGIKLKMDVSKVYFSPRLASERLRVAKKVKAGESVLVMFSGCAPYVCVIGKHSNAKEIIGVELNPEAHAYGLENLRLNKIQNARLICGDVKKVLPSLKQAFDRIVMPLPKTGEDFLRLAISVLKKGGTIHFYDFQPEKTFPESTLEKVKKVLGNQHKIRVVSAVVCGSYSPGISRVCLDFVPIKKLKP